MTDVRAPVLSGVVILGVEVVDIRVVVVTVRQAWLMRAVI